MQPSMSASSEAGPSVRTESISNAPPLLHFDGNLRFLTDCYIPYFIERCALSGLCSDPRLVLTAALWLCRRKVEEA